MLSFEFHDLYSLFLHSGKKGLPGMAEKYKASDRMYITPSQPSTSQQFLATRTSQSNYKAAASTADETGD
jgi:hypothetical protein